MASVGAMPVKDMLFSFKGRIRRRDWWLWSIAATIIYLAAYWLVGTVLLGSSGAALASFAQRTSESLLPELIVTLPLMFVSSALSAKRAQDRNMVAWPFIAIVIANTLTSFIPQIEEAFAAVQDGQAWQILILAFHVAAFIGSLYSLIMLGFMDGTPGPNRFGRSPKGIGGDTAQATAEVFE